MANFKERYEEWKKNKSVGGESSGSSHGASLQDKYKAWRAQRIDPEAVAKSIYDRTNTWLQNHNNYLTNYNQRYSGRTGTYKDGYVSDAGDWLSAVTGQKENFDIEASNILSMLDRYSDFLNPDWANSVREMLTGASTQQADILKYATSDSDYWAQFADENEYGLWQRGEGYKSKYSGMSYEDIRAAMDSTEDEEERQWLSSHQYDLIGTAEDFGDRSASGWEKYLSDQEAKQQAQAQAREEKTIWEKIGSWLGPAGAVDTSIPLGNVGEITHNLAADTSYLIPANNWSEDQKAIYGYLYGADKSAAAQYARMTNEANNQKENAEKIAAIEDWATKNGWTGAASTIGAIAMMPLSLAETLAALTEYNARGFVSTSSTPLPGQVSQAITGAISSTLNENYGTLGEGIPVIGGKGFGDAYQIGTSIAQSMISAHTQGPVGTYLVFFGSASSSTMYDAKNRGATDEQAITLGILSGLAEAAGEAFSVDKLLGMAGVSELSSFFGNVLMQAGIEASEEGVTTLLNNFSEQLVMGDKSSFNTLVQQYMTEEGLSEEEAKKKAWKNMANGLAFDMLSGAISGGVSSGLQTGVQTMFVNHDAKQTYGDHAGALVGEALEIDPDNTFAQRMQQRLDSGKNLSGGQLNRLVQQNEKTMTAQDMQSIQSAAAQRLTEFGVTENVDAIATALAKHAAGQDLTLREKQLVKQYDVVAQEMNPKNIRDGKFSAEWAQKIGTNKINALEYGRMLEADQKAQEGAEINGSQVVSQAKNEAQTVRADAVEAVITEKATTTETGNAISEDGVTRQVSTGNSVTPQKIVSISGNKVMVQTDNGMIAADDIQFGNADTDLLWRSAVQFDGITPASANGIIRAYQSGQSVTDYLNGATRQFRNGYYNQPSGGEYADKLTPAQREIIYELGQKAAGENTAKEQAKATKAKKEAVSKKENTTGKQGKVHFDRKGRTFDAVRETALNTMEQLSAALGVEFYVFESYKNAAGQLVYKDANGNEVKAPNGYYDPKDGSIHIDLNAGSKGEGIMLFTVAHELTHFIKRWSPAKFKVLANVLMKQYEAEGVSVNTLVENQIKKAKKNGRTIDYDTAYEEVVADSMEAMLTDGNAVQFMAEVKQQDKTLWQKISDWFKDLVNDLKAVVEAYKGYKPDSPEGKMVADMQDTITILEGFYADALLDAGENFQVAKAEKNTTREGDVKMSVRTVAGNDVVWIEDSGFTNAQLKDPSVIAQYIANHIGEVYRIIESGQKVYIGKDLPAEYTHSKYTSYLQKNKQATLRAKNKAATALGEMIEIATNRRWEATKHKASKDAKYGMYRYDTKFAFPVKDQNGKVTTVKAYDAELLIRNASDGKKYLYDIVNIKEDTANALDLRHKEARKGSYKAATQSGVGKDNVAQVAENVKEKFSLREDSTYAEIEEERQKLYQREIQLAQRKREAANDPTLLQAVDEVGDMFEEIRGLLPKRRNGTATQAELDRIDELKALRDERIQQVAKLQESLGLNAISQEETEIREKKEALRVASDAAWAREGAEKENAAIEKAGVPAAEYFRKKALKAFKTTTNFNEAGYMLPDGKLLNFSGGERNHRYRDHREIGEIYEATQGAAALNRFLNDGNIRIMAESPGIDLAAGVEPTKEQYAALRRFINTNGVNDGKFFVDFSDTEGHRAGNYSYQGRVNADRVINDIKHYYATGEIREQSSVSQFLYSDRDSDGNELSQEQQEYFRNSKVRDENGRLLTMYHGTPNGGFTKFRSGTYFTQNPGYADVYQNPGASSISTKKGAEAPMTYKVYLNITKPFDTRNAAERKIFLEEFYRKYGTGTPLTESGLPDWVDGMDLQEFIEEMDYDYDGLILDEGGVGGYGEEVVSRGLSYVVFDSAQVKSTENKTPTDDPDIRFSERDPELEKVNRVLEKENAELKHDIVYLKELLKLQKQVTGGTKFTKTSVEAAAGQLMKYAGAKGEKAELAGLLNGVYEYIAKGEELTWEGVKDAAQPAVDWLQSHVHMEKKLNSHVQDVLRQIRNSRVYLDEAQKKEVAYQFGSYNDYRKRMMGSVILADKAGSSLDSQWQEWASLYPHIFDPEITANDMPGALMDAIDGLHNMTDMDSYGYDAELFGQELLRQVYDSYWNVSTLYTVADKAQKEINKLKYDHIKRMATLRKFHNEKTAQLKQTYKEDLQRVRQESREKTERKLQEIQQHYQESRQKGIDSRRKTEMRRKIRRRIMDLNKLLNKGDKKRNVKEDMQDMVSKALKSADILFTDTYTGEDMIRDGVGTELTEQEAKYIAEAREILEQMGREGAESNLQGRLDYRLGKLKDVFVRERARLNNTEVSKVLGDLADAYASLENSEQSYVSGAFDENVHQYLLELKNDVGDTTVRDMSLSQLEELYKAYTMVLTTVRNANKMFAQDMKQTREQLGNQTIAEIRNAGGEHGLWLPGEDKVNDFSWNNEKPIYAFERIGSDTLTRLFEKTRAGEDTWAKDMTSAREYYLEQARKHNYDTWDFGKQYNFTSSSDVDFSLNLEQIMSIYAYSKREQAHDHLLKGGFVFDGNAEVQVNKMGIKVTYLNKTAKAHNISVENLADIVSKLTAEQKAFVDAMQEYLSDTMGGKGNEVTMQMYGVKLFNEKNYFPLRSASQYMARAKEADLKKEQGQISIVNSGFTHSTKPKANNPVVLSGFMDVWADHVNEMSMYHSFVLPMEDFRRVYNYSSPNTELGESVSVNSVIQNAYGNAATKYIDQLYRDLNGGAISDPRDTPIKVLMGKFKKAAVFSSLSVVIQQPSAIGRAFAIVDPQYFIGSKVDSKRHKALWDELKQYAPVAVIKEMGYFDTGMGKSAQDFIKGKEYHTLKEKATAIFTDENYRDELLSKGPALADELTWCTIWEAVKRETKAKNPGMSVRSEDFLQLAGKRFTEVITKTQVYDSVLARSANMRAKGLMTMWTAFMAEPTTTINMVEDALRKGKRGDKQYAARVMGAVTTSIVLNSLLVSLVRAMRDDDEDETFFEKYMQSFATEVLDGINPLTYYPLLKDIWSAAQGFDIERSDMSLLTSLTESITKLVQVYSKDTDGMDEEQMEAHYKKLSQAWWGVVDYVTALAGIPVKNVRRDINGAVNMVNTIAADLTDRDTSWGSLLDKTWEDVKNAIPVVGWFPDKTAADKLYKATVSGDTAYQKRLASSYETQAALDNAIRKGLRNNDSRIWEAAIAWNNNDLETYKRIAKEIISEGHFSQDNVVMAIQAEAKAMVETQSTSTEGKTNGLFNADKFAVAISQGNAAMADTIKSDIIDTAVANGKTAEEAASSFESAAKSALKELFLTDGIAHDQAIAALTDYCGVTDEEAAQKLQYWEFLREYPDSGLTESAVTKYYEYADPAGIGVEVYEQYYAQASACESDMDKNGNAISGSKKAKIMEVIDSLDLSKAQKNALYRAMGWAQSELWKAPWN